MTQSTIRVLVAARGRLDLDALHAAIDAEPGLHLSAVIDNDADWAARERVDADVTVVASGAPSPDVIDLIAQEHGARPHMPLVVLCAGSAEGFVRQAFTAGADDLVVTPDVGSAGAEIYLAAEKAMTRKAAQPAIAREHAPGGKLVCVLGPKGGTGKTLTASNLAVALAAEGRRVALVDLDLQFGDLGLVMGLTPERSIFDLAVAGGTLDTQKIDAFLARHPSGVRVLLAPTRPDQAAAITPEFLRELYEALRGAYHYVVVDTPPGFTPEVIATIDASSTVCLIGTLDAPSLKNAKLGAETLELMGYPAESVRLVLNRADSNVGVSHADVVSVLGRAPDVLVPSAREVVRSINSGEPIVLAGPRSEAAKAFRALADVFIRTEQPGRLLVSEPRRPRGIRALRS